MTPPNNDRLNGSRPDGFAMSAAELIHELNHLDNRERLLVIEAATRLVRQELNAAAMAKPEANPLLAVLGCLSGEPLSSAAIDEELYGKEPS